MQVLNQQKDLNATTETQTSHNAKLLQNRTARPAGCMWDVILPPDLHAPGGFRAAPTEPLTCWMYRATTGAFSKRR